MAETSNYQLNQWEKTDRIQMEDFNADNLKTDQALAKQRDEITALTAAVALCGNCQIVHQIYTGDGTTSRTFTFDRKPVLVLIRSDAYFCLASPANTVASCYSTNGSGTQGTAVWNETSVTMTMPQPYYLCNNRGGRYDLIAWMPASS